MYMMLENMMQIKPNTNKLIPSATNEMIQLHSFESVGGSSMGRSSSGVVAGAVTVGGDGICPCSVVESSHGVAVVVGRAAEVAQSL